MKKTENDILSAKEKALRLEESLYVEVRDCLAAQLKQVQETASAIAQVDVLAAFDMLLSGTFKKVITISNPNRIPAMLETENIDVVLLDMNFSSGINNGNEGIFWLGEIRKISNDLPVVLFTAYADIELAVKTVKEGATDFVVKPWDNAKLIATLLSAYRLRQSQTEVKQLRKNEESIRAVCIRIFS